LETDAGVEGHGRREGLGVQFVLLAADVGQVEHVGLADVQLDPHGRVLVLIHLTVDRGRLGVGGASGAISV
jgi:hypothetical protein